MPMTPYGNKSRKSGVAAYETGADYILIKFTDGGIYLYTYRSTGKKFIEVMKFLAGEGIGLSRFISRNVKKKYALRVV